MENSFRRRGDSFHTVNILSYLFEKFCGNFVRAGFSRLLFMLIKSLFGLISVYGKGLYLALFPSGWGLCFLSKVIAGSLGGFALSFWVSFLFESPLYIGVAIGAFSSVCKEHPYDTLKGGFFFL